MRWNPAGASLFPLLTGRSNLSGQTRTTRPMYLTQTSSCLVFVEHGFQRNWHLMNLGRTARGACRGLPAWEAKGAQLEED